MTTTTLDDSPTSVVRYAVAFAINVALFFAVFPLQGADVAPPGLAAQIALIDIIAMTMLFVNFRGLVFPFAMAFSLVASGVVALVATTHSNWLSLGIALATLGNIYFWWHKNPEKLRATPLDDDDDRLELTVQLAPGLAPERVQEILQVREDMMNLGMLFIGQEIGTIAMSYDQQLEYALKKDATDLDELLASARKFLDEQDEAVDALHHPPA